MSKILVIDDDHDIVELLKTRLEDNGYEVSTASEGVEGMAKTKDEKPDLILLDVMMPVMDGLSFVNDLKRNADLEKIPIIVLTAKDQLQDLFDGANIEHYVTKPFEVDDLLAKVKDALG